MLANASLAIARTMKFEGVNLTARPPRTGYVDDPEDPGGETNFGLSKRFMNLVGLKDNLKTMKPARAKEIYKEYFWDAYNCGMLESQSIANEYYDWCVLTGPRASGLALQRALRAVSNAMETKAFIVTEDGIVGPMTANKVNQLSSTIAGANTLLALLSALKSEQAGYARDIDNPRFEKGWVKRAYA